jgi:hypothetical protein
VGRIERAAGHGLEHGHHLGGHGGRVAFDERRFGQAIQVE